MALNTFKYITVYYNKGDRKPYDINGKPISYLGTDYVGANEATIIRFFIGDDTGVIDAVADVKRPDGEKAFLVMSKVNVGGDVFYELPLTDWHTAKAGKLTIAFKAFNGTIIINDGVIEATGLRVIVSDIFNIEIGYAPNSVQETPPFDPNDLSAIIAALTTKLDKENGINVVQALPTPNDGSLNGRWYLVKSGGLEQLGKLYVFDVDTPVAVELEAGGIKLTPVGNGNVTVETGRLDWQQSNGTASLGLYNDMYAQLGEDVFYYAKCQDASNIAQGDIVQFAGYQGDHALVKRAVQSEINANPKLIMGIAKQNISNNTFGYISHFGKVENIDTKGVAVGSFIYFDSAGSTPGAWTITKPVAPYPKVLIAVIIKAETSSNANNGVILVRPTFYPNMIDINDVSLTSTTDGDILRYDVATNTWQDTADLTNLETNLQDYKDDIADGTLIVGKAQNDKDGNEFDATYLKKTTASSTYLTQANASSTYLTQANATSTYIPLSQKGANNGVAALDSLGKIPSSQLPGAYDEILEYDTYEDLPETGANEYIYLVKDTNFIYRWSGSVYVQLNAQLALGETSTTAYRGDLGAAVTTLANNIVNGTQVLTDTRITNSAVGTQPLIVNGIASTSVNLQEWKLNGSIRSNITSAGAVYFASNIQTYGSLVHAEGINNSRIQPSSTGTVISRNINDTNPSLRVIKQQGTGNILELQTGTSTKKFEVDVNGWFYQNGTRLFTQPNNATNTFFGTTSGGTSATGQFSTAFGNEALKSVSSGGSNTAFGWGALSSLTTASENTGVGVQALWQTTAGGNTAFGRSAGFTLTTGTQNTFIGYASGQNASQLATAINSTAIGYQSYTDKSNQMVFGNASVTEFKFDRNSGATALLPNASFSGNVGIGTTSPDVFSRFHGKILGISTSSGSSFIEVNGASGSNGGLEMGAGGTRTGVILSNASTMEIGSVTSIPLLMVTNGSERMRIASGGNVGIGTTSPSYRLHVSNTGNSAAWFAETDSSTNPANNTPVLTLQNLSNTNNAWSEMNYVDSNGSVTAMLGVQHIDQTNHYGDFVIFTRGTSGYNEKFRVGSNGNVGVGTASPTAKLQVSGIIRSTGTTGASSPEVSLLSAGYWTWKIRGDGNNLKFSNDDTVRMTVNSDGKVGIGTTNPEVKFDVLTTNNEIVGRFINDNSSFNTNVLNVEAFRNTTDGTYNLIAAGLAGVGYRFFVRDSGNVVNTNNSYGAISDIKLKENITDAKPKLSELNKVRVVNYNFKNDKTKQLGVIAQELEKIFPGMVEETEDKDKDGNLLGTKTKSVKYSVFIPMLIKAIQELKAEIDGIKGVKTVEEPVVEQTTTEQPVVKEPEQPVEEPFTPMTQEEIDAKLDTHQDNVANALEEDK